MKPTVAAETTDAPRIIQNPKGEFANGIFIMFIPKKLENMVGIAINIVIEVNSFITMFRLFDIMEANASMVPLNIPEYMLAISMACLFSIRTSSSKSSSSEYFLMMLILNIFSSTTWLALKEVVI